MIRENIAAFGGAMSDDLWHQLPSGFLKRSPKGWRRLDRSVRLLVVELARAQKFQCAFCDETKGLIIEHDHWPERGSGDILTVYNVRGLACSRCNWHIGMHEADARGDYRGWDDAYIYISENNFYPYVEAYESRVRVLLEEELEQRLGTVNYWRRRLFLQKFDDWHEWGGRYPWRSYFSEIKERQRWKIRTPEQFWKTLAACVCFIVEEKQKNPDFELPEKFQEVLVRVKIILDDLWPHIEERYRALQTEKQLTALNDPAHN
jgi:hypothetical protein